MDEHEFQRLLDLFPVVRPRDFHLDSEPPTQSTSSSAQDHAKEWQAAWEAEDTREDAFWKKLKLVIERKAGAAEAEGFCKALQRNHNKLVHEELSLDAACSFMNLSSS